MEKQRCLVKSFVRDFSRQNGRKIQVKPKCRLQPEIANLVSRRTYRCIFFLRTTVFKHLDLYITPCRFYLENFPTEDVQYYYSRQHNLVKKPDLILNEGIFTIQHFNVTGQCIYTSICSVR
jgi:hypothetical protein